MSAWSQFYKDRCNDGYVEYVQRRYRPFLEEILRHCPTSFLEEGCGIGTISKILEILKPGGTFHLSDRDHDIMGLASQFTRFDPKLDNIILGYRAPKSVDVAFGHGVLEHFEDFEIQAILDRQYEISNRVVHYVPTDLYKVPSFGDERLLPPEYWVSEFDPTHWFTFNQGHDLCLVWERPNET